MKKPEKAIAVAAGAVLRQGKILLIRRNFEPFIGCWGMPGGKIHLGEYIEEATEREVREETGVKARFERFCGVLSEKVSMGGQGSGARAQIQSPELKIQTARFAAGEGREAELHYLVLVSLLKGLTSRITESREGAVRWFQVRDLTELRDAMIPSDWLMLEQFGILKEPISTQRHKGTKRRILHSRTGPFDHLTTAQSYARCEIAKHEGRYRVVRFY